jgi:hypothetical protein
MTRYEMHDAQGRALYKGEVISNRRYVSAHKIGYAPGIAGASLVVALLGLLGLPWLLAVVVGGLAGQMLINALQHRYSRWIWEIADRERARELLAEKLTPEEIARRKAKARRDEKIRNVRISMEAELPFVDYDSGEVWPTGTLADHLAELEREAAEIERKERNQVRSAEVASPIKLDMDPGGQWVVTETGLLRGRPATPGAARRAKLSDGRIVDLTNDDLQAIRESADLFGSFGSTVLPSGMTLTGSEVVALAADLRRIESVRPEPCPHGIPAHLRCGRCAIDLGTPEGIERGARMLDRAAQRAAEPRSYWPGPVGYPRPVAAIRRDMETLMADVAAGRLTRETGQSLDQDLLRELAAALEAEEEAKRDD